MSRTVVQATPEQSRELSLAFIVPQAVDKLGGIISAMQELAESGGLEYWAQEDLFHCIGQLESCRKQLGAK